MLDRDAPRAHQGVDAAPRCTHVAGDRSRPPQHEEAARALRGADGALALTFEIVYGHALKPAPRVRVADQSAIPVKDMQAMLRSGRKPG